MLSIVGMGRRGDNVSTDSNDEEYDWNEGVKVEEGGLLHTVGRPLAGYRLGHLKTPRPRSCITLH